MLSRRIVAFAAAFGTLAVAVGLADLPSPVATSAQEEPLRLYLPLVGMQAHLAQLPVVPTLPRPAATPTVGATATDAPTPTDEPTPTDVPTATATPFVCGDLPDRLRVTDLDLGEDRIRTGGPDFWTTNPIFVARQRTGTTWVGWPDTDGQIHLTPLDAEEQRAGDDITVQGSEIRGLVAHDDGLALLVVHQPVVCTGEADDCSMAERDAQDETAVMSLVRLGAAGEELWRKDLVGAAGTGSKAKWIDWQPHESRLVWDGRRYAAYIGHTYNTGGSGTHQGDLLWLFDAEGTRVDADAGWDWGCSHSLDVRLAWNAARLGPVCLSDAYPTKAFHFNHDEKEIRREPSGDAAGGSDARLGGLVATRDGFMMTFASPQGRSSTDVGIVRIGNDASVGAVTWLTNTPDVDEDGPHLASYGTGLLATWVAGGEHLAMMLDATGKPAGEPVALGARIAPKDDMLGGLPGGDVLWAVAGPQPGLLRVARLDFCQPR